MVRAAVLAAVLVVSRPEPVAQEVREQAAAEEETPATAVLAATASLSSRIRRQQLLLVASSASSAASAFVAVYGWSDNFVDFGAASTIV